ncbi:hypothetical protein K438DRAFT_1863900 [Mycena galopus ATCC 62051]|nr:hypothetical protein K438DRAFT_1863900 [Mycena galopus ATCC 62051]
MAAQVRSVSLGKKGAQLLKFWKKPRPTIPDFPSQTHESALVLPPEIWLDILSYFPDYDLEPLSRICRHLRWIVLPLFFRSQQMFPFPETFEFRELGVSIEEYTARSLQRLSFLSSAQLSFAIQELAILYYARGYNRRHQATHAPMEVVMRPLVEALPKFENLTRLILQFPPCDDTLFSALNSLRLESLELEVLPTALGEIPIPAQKEFLFNCSSSPIQRLLPEGLSLRLLFPKSLERLVAGPTGTEILARTLVCHPSGLISLETLDLSLYFVGSPHFPSALAACPNLSSLRLRSSSSAFVIPASLPSLPRSFVPLLSSYHGPADLAPLFAHSRTLRITRLWSSHSVSTVSDPWLLAPVLQQLGPTLTTLELSVTVVRTSSLLETIRDAFPSLSTLALNAHFDSFHPGTVARRVVSPPPELRSANLTLPSGLPIQRLRLGTQLAGAPNADADSVRQLCESARKVIQTFPGDYDPTSWRSWVVDRPWYCVEWTRGDTEPDASSTVLGGTLLIEYGEHYFQGFERGTRFESGTRG